MEEFLSKVAKAPTSAKVGIGVLGVVIMVVVHYALIYSEQEAELQRLREELAATENKLFAKEAIAKNLTKFQREVERLEQEVNEARTSLPSKKEIAGLLRRVSDLAEKAGLQIKKFTPLSEKQEAFYASVPIEMTLSGSYHEILSFFYSISKLSRIVNISNVRMSQPAIREKKVLVDVSCDATTYRLLTDAELNAKKGKKG